MTRPKTAEQLIEEEKVQAEQKRPPTNEEKKKAPAKNAADAPFEAQTNKLQFTPHLVNLRTGPLPTMSHLFEYLRHLNTMELDHRFGLIIDDKVFED